MRWASALQEGNNLEAAIDAAAAQLREQLNGEKPDLTLAFISNAFSDSYEKVPALIHKRLGDGLLLGCSAGGVIGGGREVEEKPAVSLTAAVLPGVMLNAFHADHEGRLHQENVEQKAEGSKAAASDAPSHFLLLADPLTFNAQPLLETLDKAFPDGTKLGGLASGGTEAGENVLYLRSHIHRSGLVGVAMQGNLEIDTLVAQGCRPIGEPMFVTACRGNVLLGLDSQPPVTVLTNLYEDLEPDDQELLQRALFIGIAMPGPREEYLHGDFLIRNITGSDSDTGSLSVGTALQENSVVQFHLRDAQTSAEDLETLLQRFDRVPEDRKPRGSVLFSCMGRGVGLFGVPDHDSGLLRRHLGDIPVGGFFCNGEIGPVHGTTFVHGYTSAFGLFRPRTEQ